MTNNQKKELLWEDLSMLEKKLIKESIQSTRIIGVIVPLYSLLRGRCYLTAILSLGLGILLPGIGYIITSIIQYIYLPERSFNNSQGPIKSIIYLKRIAEHKAKSK